MLLPVLTAAAGYLLDGLVGAVSGLLIPMGPLLLVWISGRPERVPRRGLRRDSDVSIKEYQES